MDVLPEKLNSRVVLGASLLALGVALLPLSSAFAQALDVPGAADPSRIRPPAPMVDPSAPVAPRRPTVSIMPEQGAPQGAAAIRFTLNSIQLEGISAFAPEELAPIYAPLLCEEITLDKVWGIANAITAHYRDHGYFLSRAYVPAQEMDIRSGNIQLRVVEGYIGQVKVDDPVSTHPVFRELTEELYARRPVTTDEVESYLLRINDLPGKSWRAVVKPLDNGADGAVAIELVPQDAGGKGLIQFDNSSSRYLGPWQALAHYTDSFLPLQQTALTFSASTPMDEMKYFSGTHLVPIAPRVNARFGASYIYARPGYTLTDFKIRSRYYEFSAGVEYQPIRQWLENLRLFADVLTKDTRSKALGAELTHDSLRQLRVGAAYDVTDRWGAYNTVEVELRQGLGAFGASEEGSLTASRFEGDPEFTLLELSLSRQQALTDAWAVTGRLGGQVASGPLLSSEEFGYGGQQFGRGYDPSEITGDHGVAASLQLAYTALPQYRDTRFMPFAFYDIGRVWNEDTGSDDISASSAGFGLYAEHGSGVSGTLTLAKPLTKVADAPLYGNGSNPRVVFSLGYRF